MSRFNVTIAVAAVCGSMILEGCKTDAAKKQEKTLEKFTKEMKKVTDKADHKSKDCDDVQTNYLKEVADNNKDATKKTVKKYTDNNKKAAGDDYAALLKTCKESTKKEEDTMDVQQCIYAAIPEDKRWDLKDLVTKKEKTPSEKDIKKAAEELKKIADKTTAYVQEFGNCYYKSDPKVEDFSTIQAAFPGWTLEVKDDAVVVTAPKVESA